MKLSKIDLLNLKALKLSNLKLKAFKIITFDFGRLKFNHNKKYIFPSRTIVNWDFFKINRLKFEQYLNLGGFNSEKFQIK